MTQPPTPPNPEHDLHRRRLGRNVGVGGALVFFVVVLFALTVVKFSKQGAIEGFDHVVRPSLQQQDKE